MPRQHRVLLTDLTFKQSDRNPRLRGRSSVLNYASAGFRSTVRVTERNVMSSSWPQRWTVSAISAISC
jgi:hypothetical protein